MILGARSRVRSAADQSKTPPGVNPRRGSALGTRKRNFHPSPYAPILVAQGVAVVPVPDSGTVGFSVILEFHLDPERWAPVITAEISID
jgi:hypothetical protein